MTADDQPGGGPADPDELDPRVRDRLLHRRCVRFEQALADRLAPELLARPYGVVRLSPRTAPLYSTNHVEVTRPVAVAELLADVDGVFEARGLPHRRVQTAVPEVAWVLAPALADRGWTAERLVTMVHDGRTAPSVSPVGVGAVDLDAWAPFAQAVLEDVEWGRDPAVQRARAERDRSMAERIDVRWVMAADRSAGCHVYRQGGVAQIEEVHVLSEQRGRGIGTALMAAARRACGDAATAFLVADAEDWPRHWYRRLGFRPVGSSWAWLRPPPAQDPPG